jgi:flavin reductase (DIM6/NTAB) family NADH-FMN oxidoreductase RutF
VTEPEAFKNLVSHFDNQMLIVTTASDGEVSGCLVGFAAQCSIDPPRLLVCLSKKNHTYRVAATAEVLVVHVLREADIEVARHFGELTGDKVDKFAAVDWTPGPAGVPVLRGLDWMAGRVMGRHDLGDHVGFVLEALGPGSAERVDEPRLGLTDALPMEPGHAP